MNFLSELELHLVQPLYCWGFLKHLTVILKITLYYVCIFNYCCFCLYLWSTFTLTSTPVLQATKLGVLGEIGCHQKCHQVMIKVLAALTLLTLPWQKLHVI